MCDVRPFVPNHGLPGDSLCTGEHCLHQVTLLARRLRFFLVTQSLQVLGKERHKAHPSHQLFALGHFGPRSSPIHDHLASGPVLHQGQTMAQWRRRRDQTWQPNRHLHYRDETSQSGLGGQKPKRTQGTGGGSAPFIVLLLIRPPSFPNFTSTSHRRTTSQLLLDWHLQRRVLLPSLNRSRRSTSSHLPHRSFH